MYSKAKMYNQPVFPGGVGGGQYGSPYLRPAGSGGSRGYRFGAAREMQPMVANPQRLPYNMGAFAPLALPWGVGRYDPQWYTPPADLTDVATAGRLQIPGFTHVCENTDTFCVPYVTTTWGANSGFPILPCGSAAYQCQFYGINPAVHDPALLGPQTDIFFGNHRNVFFTTVLHIWQAPVATIATPHLPALPLWPLPWSLPVGATHAPGYESMNVTRTGTDPRVDADGRPYARPYEVPATELVLPGVNPFPVASGRPAVRPALAPVMHAQVPDGAKKRRAPAALIGALYAFHTATEADDGFGALWDALKEHGYVDGKRPGLLGKIGAVADNWSAFLTDHALLDSAVENIIVEGVVDAFAAKLFGARWNTGDPAWDNSRSNVWWDTANPPGNIDMAGF